MARAHDARSIALDVLAVIEKGGFLQPAIEKRSRKAKADERERKLALELVMGVLRWRARLDFYIKPYLRAGSAKTDVALLDIIRLALFQIRFLDRIPTHAAVHTAVEQARLRRGQGPSRFVNGVLRALLRGDDPPLPQDPVQAVAVEESHPLWLIQRWSERFGLAEAKAMAAANNDKAPLTIRPEADGLERDELRDMLEGEEASVEDGRWTPDALNLVSHPRPFTSDSFMAGSWLAQDEASQLVVRMLGPCAGETIWDMCAAPGGKTRYIKRLMGENAQILATDIHQKKLHRLAAALKDLGVSTQCVSPGSYPSGPFDRVLVDAPCTALGLLHRHPEIRWRRSLSDILGSVERQAEILRSGAMAVRPGGVLVYSVCSVAPEEGPQQIQRFLESHPNFVLETPDDPRVDWDTLLTDGTLQTTPYRHGIDGFFAARMRRGAKI